MAFNWQTFRTRALTAIFFAAVMLAGLLWDQWSLLILFSVIHFGCWWEYLQLLEKIHGRYFHPYVKTGLMVMGYGIALGFCGTIYSLHGYLVNDNLSLPVSAAGFTLLLIGIFQRNTIGAKSFAAALAGFLYISVSWGMMLNLYGTLIRINDTGDLLSFNFIPLLIIISIWINDTMAYIVGSFIGKTPLSRISPKKTWEGTLGGIILSVGVTALIAIYGFSAHSIAGSIIIIAALSAIAGTFGDLLESKLKRMAGVKDSGNLMPGHGGFLDRFDSLLLATPCVWLFVKIMYG